MINRNCSYIGLASADPEGGTGGRTPPPPPRKSQVIWVSIGNKQMNPPGKIWTPRPPGKCWTPFGTLKNDRFLWNWLFDFCKISWGLKKQRYQSFFFARLTWNPPPPPPPPDENSWIRACLVTWKPGFVASWQQSSWPAQRDPGGSYV